MKKKIIFFLTLMFLVVIGGCFNSKEESQLSFGEGIEVTYNENSTEILTKENLVSAEIEITGEIAKEDIKISSDYLYILEKNDNGAKVYIAFVGGKEGNISININNIKKGSINLVKGITKKELNSTAVLKRAGEKLLGDFNNSQEVDLQDFNLFKQNFGKQSTTYDIGPAGIGTGVWSGIYCYLNGDGKVGLEDLTVFASNFGKKEPTSTEIQVTSVKINGTTRVNKGDTITLTVSVEPSNAANKLVTWDIDQIDKAELLVLPGMDNTATLTGKIKGEVTITVTSNNGKTDSIKVIVVEDIVTGIEVHAKYTHVWAWGKNGAESVDEFTTWPGQAMEAETNGWYKWYFADAKSIKLIFSNAGGSKTGELQITEEGKFWYDGTKFLTSNPDVDTEAPVVTLNPAPLKEISGTVYYTESSLQIGLNITDNQDLSPKAYYTTNGTTPTVSSTLYNGTKINVTDNMTLKVFAIDKESNSKIYTYIFKLNQDVESPVVTADPKAGRYNEGTVLNVKLTVTDNKDTSPKLYYTTNGTEPTENFNNFYNNETITITANTTIKTLAVDASGNKSTKSFAYTFGNSDVTHRDFREENVYFMMTDRFYDEDKTNNNIWGDEYLPGGESQMYDYDESKTGVLTYYHGGDFAGIIKNLDYLKEMGFTAIWITPVVKQPEGRYFYDGSEGGDPYQASAFHGYWAYDFDQIDPHLHSSGKDNDGWEDFKTLAKELHAKDMRLMLDIVTNHGHPGSPAPPSKWIDVKDAVIMDGQVFSYSNDPYKDATDKTKGFFNYLGGYDIPGLIDFNERGPAGYDAREHLKNVYKRFIDAGVDAFRIDTVAYMTDEWWGEFADAMYNHAKSIGNDHFYMVGESWTGRGTAIQRHSKDTTKSFHMLDMQLSCMDYPGQMHAVFRDGGDYSLFNTVTSSDVSQGLDDEGATWTGMFVDNHDVFRANGIFNEQQYKNALTYIYLFRGIPIVYYGTEAMYSWNGAYATTNKDDVVARWMLGAEGINHVKNNKPGMYKHIKTLNHVRMASEPIQKGIQKNIELKGDKAIFTREFNGKKAYVAISKGAGYSHTFTDMASGTYKVMTPNADGTFSETTANISGTYSVNVPANGFVIVEK